MCSENASYCPQVSAWQEEETLGSYACAALQIWTQARLWSQDWIFYEHYYMSME